MKHRTPDLVLIAATFVFGGTFLSVQLALKHIGMFELLATRFVLGALVVGVLCGKRLIGMSRHDALAGVLIGLALFIGIALQTCGLRTIDSSKSGFVTALYVPFVPLLQLVLFRFRPTAAAWLGTAIALIGLCLLSAKSGFSFTLGLGEWLTLGSALAFALQILLISRFSQNSDALRVTFLQLVVVSVLSLVAIPLAGEGAVHWTPSLAMLLGGLGIFATGLGILCMNWAQKTVPATRATLIYALEPVWAGIIGAMAGERFTRPAIAGCVLILVGVLVGEFSSLGERKTGSDPLNLKDDSLAICS